jgi:hypothetical protein
MFAFPLCHLYQCWVGIKFLIYSGFGFHKITYEKVSISHLFLFFLNFIQQGVNILLKKIKLVLAMPVFTNLKKKSIIIWQFSQTNY